MLVSKPGLFNALVLYWMSPKCHTLMKPPSGSGVGIPATRFHVTPLVATYTAAHGVALAPFSSFVDLLTEIEDPRRAEGGVVSPATRCTVCDLGNCRRRQLLSDNPQLYQCSPRPVARCVRREVAESSSLHDDPWYLATTRSRLATIPG